jgi:hypothetical protein
MRNKIEKVIDEIYKRMYAEADPPIYDLTPYYGKEEPFFLNHYLDDKRQDEIINEVLDEFKIKNKYYRRSVKITIILGSSPTTVKREKNESIKND